MTSNVIIAVVAWAAVLALVAWDPALHPSKVSIGTLRSVITTAANDCIGRASL
jgi:hypothetical protein